MENQEIIEIEEITTVEGVQNSGTNNALKFGIGAAIIAGIAYGGYKLMKKLKVKKAQKAEESEAIVVEDFEDEEE